MKRTLGSSFVFIAIVSTGLGLDDPVAKTVSDERKEVTSYSRDGEKILTVMRHPGDKPQEAMLTQIVIMGGKPLVFISDYKGKHSYNIEPNVPVTVGIEHAETGKSRVLS